MVKVFGKFPHGYKLSIKNDNHTCKVKFAVWKGDAWNSEIECLKRGLTKQEAIDFINNHETIIPESSGGGFKGLDDENRKFWIEKLKNA